MGFQDTEFKKRPLILFNVVLLTFMACLDSSIVNVALPVMAKKFSVGMSLISTVVSSYLVAISATILIFGSLGDIKGKTRIFKFGIIIFTLGSVLCSLSNSIYFLILSRVVQAIGASAFMATNQGIITRVYPVNERGRALGIVGSFVALGTMVGPPLGGFIVANVSWRYIFLINIPFGIFAFIFGQYVLPKDTEFSGEKFDIKGSILFILAITSLFASIVIGQDYGYGRLIVIIGFIIAAVSFIMFLLLERKTEKPLLELSMFKNGIYSLSLICSFLIFITISTSGLMLPFYFQDALGMSPSVAGMFLITSPLVLFCVSPLSGHLSDKIGSEVLTLIGLILTGAGLFLMSSYNLHTSSILIVLYIVLMSVGTGMFQSPNTALIMSSVPRNRLGIAGSINGLVRNLGLVVGISMSTGILYSIMSRKLGHAVTTFSAGMESTFVYAMKFVYIVVGMLAICGAVLTAIRIIVNKMNKKAGK